MKFVSTLDGGICVDLKEAVVTGMPVSGGLFQPSVLPLVSSALLHRFKEMEFIELASHLAELLIGDDIPEASLREICRGAFDFPLVLRRLLGDSCVLELFHGPTLAFKDFGARFLARLLAWFQRGENRPVTVLTATSGDTGGAVASGFYDVPGVRVLILYPKGRISAVQERQIATLGKNIRSLAIRGSFDDCQTLVKEALADGELRRTLSLTTANSINPGRLLPQIFYYFYAVSRLPESQKHPVVAVPSGNFGNITAAAMARKMGLPVERLVAATTINDTVDRYMKNGRWAPGDVHPTLAMAMDIADPNNFPRLLHLYDRDRFRLGREITACVVTDDQIRETIARCYSQDNYLFDPHSASGWYALRRFLETRCPEGSGISVATAHPVKFCQTVEPLIGEKIEIPESLQSILDRPLKSEILTGDISTWKEWLREWGRPSARS